MSRELIIKNGFVAKQKMIQSLFGDKKKSDKFIATAVQIASDYKLSECHPNSIIDACVHVAQMGLDLNPTLSHAYLVPFKKSVQLIVSARGYTALLSRTGWKVKSYIVNEDDYFEYSVNGFDEKVKFEKNLDSENDDLKYAVALAQSPDGTLYVEVMNKTQIEKHRKVSSNQKGAKATGVWAEWYDEMALKTVIKKLVKRLPIGEDVAMALSVDDKPIEAEIVKEDKVDLNSMAAEPHDPITGEVDLLSGIDVEVGSDE